MKEFECIRCQLTKSVTYFRKKRSVKKGFDSVCKRCRGAYERKNYSTRESSKNEVKVVIAKNRRFDIRRKHYELLCKSECIDCGESNPVVLEFDHLRDKEYNISMMVAKGYVWEKILKEIDKCEIVCSNCHKIRTAKRAGWYKDFKELS